MTDPCCCVDFDVTIVGPSPLDVTCDVGTIFYPVDSGPGGGGVTDHGALTGLDDDDHPQYALADGTRGDFATPVSVGLAIADHEADTSPHPAYDDIPDLTILLENGLI